MTIDNKGFLWYNMPLINKDTHSNMSLFKLKNNSKGAQIAVDLALIIALLANFASPPIVRADFEQNTANSSQKFADSGLIIKSGLATTVQPIPKSKGERPDKVVKAVITAYTSTVDQTDDDPFIAASGKRVHDGMIAANGLPFGTKIKIPSLYGDKIFTVEDRMNKRYGFGRMDVWLDTSKAEARKFGVKRLEVEIFYPEKAIAKK